MKLFSFSKRDKLKSKTVIDRLFLEGKSIVVYPLRLVYVSETFSDETHIKVAVSVSKKRHKKAVDRNRIKRLMREAYRLEKVHYFNKNKTGWAIMILYLGKEVPSQELISKTMQTLLKKFELIITKTKQHED